MVPTLQFNSYELHTVSMLCLGCVYRVHVSRVMDMCLKHDGSTAYLSYTTSAIVMVSQCYVMLNQLVTPSAHGVHDFMQHDLALGGGSTLNGCLLHGR